MSEKSETTAAEVAEVITDVVSGVVAETVAAVVAEAVSAPKEVEEKPKTSRRRQDAEDRGTPIMMGDVIVSYIR